ncbi:MAG: STT3 domain-containing protein [Candidatus Diapherotrites archaeon]|nr:STT3 domain-containing protein [Candidatus Diapherotrites archaeon]
MGLLDWVKTIDKKQLFIVLLLFLLAFGIRGYNLKYGLFFEFDTYYHARMTSYVLQGIPLPEHDPLAYYQIGGSSLPSIGPFFWQLNALIYNIVNLGSGYDKEKLIQLAKIIPAIYGALTVVGMFFLGKAIFRRKKENESEFDFGTIAGITAALIAATIPAFAYRTMAGFFEDDSFGFMWMVWGFVFFAEAIREPKLAKKNLVYAGIAGLLLGAMAFAWQFYLVVPMILLGYFIFTFLKYFALKTFEETKALTAIFITSFAGFSILTFIKNPDWVHSAIEMASIVLPIHTLIAQPIIFGIVVASIVLLAVLFWIKRKNKQYPSVNLALTAVLYVMLIILLITFTDPGKVLSNAFRPNTVLSQTIGEESMGLNAFGEKFSIMIVFPILALLIIPYRIFRKKDEHLSLILFFWIAITFFMAYYKLQYTFTFGLPIAAAAAVCVVHFCEFFKGKLVNALEPKIIALGLGFLVLTSVAAGAIFMPTQPPSIEVWDGWKEGLNWMQQNLPENAKMFNWWDVGHWVAFIAEKRPFLDNRNAYPPHNGEFAKFLIATDFSESLEIVRKFQPEYLLLDRDMFSSAQSFLIYGYNTLNFNEIPNLTQTKLEGYSGFALLCGFDGTNYSCGGNQIPGNQMANLPNVWKKTPSEIQEGRKPIWYYRNFNNNAIFVLGKTMNDSTLAKIWFHEQNAMNYFEEVYSNQRMKIFKIKEIVYE